MRLGISDGKNSCGAVSWCQSTKAAANRGAADARSFQGRAEYFAAGPAGTVGRVGAQPQALTLDDVIDEGTDAEAYGAGWIVFGQPFAGRALEKLIALCVAREGIRAKTGNVGGTRQVQVADASLRTVGGAHTRHAPGRRCAGSIRAARTRWAFAHRDGAGWTRIGPLAIAHLRGAETCRSHDRAADLQRSQTCIPTGLSQRATGRRAPAASGTARGTSGIRYAGAGSAVRTRKPRSAAGSSATLIALALTAGRYQPERDDECNEKVRFQHFLGSHQATCVPLESIDDTRPVAVLLPAHLGTRADIHRVRIDRIRAIPGPFQPLRTLAGRQESIHDRETSFRFDDRILFGGRMR